MKYESIYKHNITPKKIQPQSPIRKIDLSQVAFDEPYEKYLDFNEGSDEQELKFYSVQSAEEDLDIWEGI